MQKLEAVEVAKALMNEAKEWSVWRWLFEKRRVRAVADTATEALDKLDRKVKAGWSDDLKKAYRELDASKRAKQKAEEEAKDIDPDIKAAVRRVKEADDMAYDARMDAEATFDEAERQLSASMAREGAEKAIASWELREKAIRRSEAVGRRAASG